MTNSISKHILHASDKQHLMLLYDNELDRSSAEIDCINQALSNGQYCVYATVDANQEDFILRLSHGITNYQKHVLEGSFKVVNFKPFYDGAAKGELNLFVHLKAEVEKTLSERLASGKNGKALLVADAACNLARHKQFDECAYLETWWQDTYNEWMANGMDITIVCAHPSSVLKKQPHLSEQNRIAHLHSITLDLTDLIGNRLERKPASASTDFMRILVVEPEDDIRLVYRQYLQGLHVVVNAVAEGKDCLEQLVLTDRRTIYDMIVIDTHIKDMNGIDLAKKILDANPSQQIIFTTTWDRKTMLSELLAHSIDGEGKSILQKPFVFSHLLALIRPAKSEVVQ